MAEKPVLLISACLLGQKVRYDGKGQILPAARLAALNAHYTLQAVCPECAGGLPVPRPPAEIVGGDGAAVWERVAQVFGNDGTEMSAAFLAGAEAALQLAKAADACGALLKSGSPSCGNTRIHDGRFTGGMVPGRGVTAEWLHRNGIAVWDDSQADGPCAIDKTISPAGSAAS
ncbi:DUF523 domain-containing protein [Paludibacterium yongneupense]|uniref:DUF523 domain-containing protein n=1 Tax=Paludibacterium yongneupense TaxID=400061 RepID=UPI00040A7A3C|nr:DUF523 domain-containing protein [Paludibacterium yongneupense]